MNYRHQRSLRREGRARTRRDFFRFYDNPLTVQNDLDAALDGQGITEAPPLGCNLLHRLADGRIVVPHTATQNAC